MADHITKEDSLKLENILKAIDAELDEEQQISVEEIQDQKEEPDSKNQTILPLSDRFQLIINAQKTKSFCRYLPPVADKTPDIKAGELLNRLKETGIVYGLLEKNIQKAIALIKSNPQAELEVVAAVGLLPKSGTPSRISYWIGNESYAKDKIEIYARKNDLLLRIEPATAGISGKTIFGEEIPPPAVENKTYIAGENIYTNVQGEFYASCAGVVKLDNNIIRVREITRDAICTVKLSADFMTAMIDIEPAMGKGRHISYHDVRLSLSREQVCAGIDEQAIRQAIMQVELKALPISDWVVAKGKPPRFGKDAVIHWHIPPNQPTKRYTIDADGSINFYDANTITTVTADTHLATYTPPTIGKAGYTVQGIRIEGKKGKPLSIHAGENVEEREEGKEWYATCSGKYTLDNDALNVLPLFYVDGDVDFSVGNIDFIGDVIIRGNILDGFDVRATGHISVGGTIEAAQVCAGKNVEVRQGIFGKEKGKVRAEEDVISSFLQNADVEAGRNVIVSNQILNSVVQAVRKIEVKTGKGSIIGGITFAGHEIIARTIGTEYGTITRIDVGTDFRVLQQMSTIETKKINLAKQLTVLNEFFKSKNIGIDPFSANEPQQKLIRTAQQKQQELQHMISNLSGKYKELATQLYTTDSPNIHASLGVMPGVGIRIRNSQYKVAVPLKRCTITYDVEKEKIILDIKKGTG
ncbi:MAG: DUF342 domain-containing protein [Candidatus Omnitrophota bacterium]|jgi:uncharacterized protein (DUF342 family)|nr:MAG: DUF342 domain-containing protein [Candidatus Omnitrophota bacterium]